MAQDVKRAEDISPHMLPSETFFAERRAALTRQYYALPAYGSRAFWTHLEGRQEDTQTLPLEVLVKVVREADARDDKKTRRRLCTIILARVQTSNEQWVRQVLASIYVQADERRDMVADLYADLCELLLRTLIDPNQTFWEENFLHSLRFARQHAYKSFLRREGHLISNSGRRVPRSLLESLEHFSKPTRKKWFSRDEDADQTNSTSTLDIRDERAEQAFEQVEQADLLATLMLLPMHQRTVVWLIFFEGHTTKTVSTLLKTSGRTVRNRLRAALTQLREVFEAEQEVVDGEGA